MVRTQIYLTEEEREALRRLAEAHGTSQSALIREAVDRLIEEQHAEQEQEKKWLDEAAGLWADRDDLPDFRAMRREWDRYGPDGERIDG